jgi:nucleoside-diphosphate-sugar epimerase
VKILLTGGLGFIGKNFLIGRPKNWQVTSLDLVSDPAFEKKVLNTKFYQVDLTNVSALKKVAGKIKSKFDACLYLAANGDPALSVPDPLWDLRMTTETLINVVGAFDISKLIYLSSGAVYDGNKGLIHPHSLVDPKLPYAISHKAAEEYTRFFKSSGKVNDYVVIRFFGAYGPHEPKRKIYSNLVKAFGLRHESEFTIRGDGKNLIDAMEVSDAVAGLAKVIQAKKANLTIDFCKGEHPTITQLVRRAAETFDQKVKIKYEGRVPEYNNFYASNREFEKIFGFRPKISLEQGLKRLYRFYNE